jgi:DNA polymerase III subunit epsilon
MQICNIDKLNFIAIDFETANTFGNSACSVGLVRYIDGKEAGSISSLIHPAKMYFIPEWTETIHHISYDDVRDKPYFPEVWQTIVQPFLDETPELPFVAHNARFDMGVIKNCCEYYGMDFSKRHYFDSLMIAKRTWPEFECHKLTYLGEKFGIDYLAHDALEDSRTCGLVVTKAAEKYGVNSVDSLLNKCGIEMNYVEVEE